MKVSENIPQSEAEKLEQYKEIKVLSQFLEKFDLSAFQRLVNTADQAAH